MAGGAVGLVPSRLFTLSHKTLTSQPVYGAASPFPCRRLRRYANFCRVSPSELQALATLSLDL